MKTTQEVLESTVRRCRERNIIIPTYEEMADPTAMPAGILEELAGIGLWDLDPRNLFRITWKNQPVERGGGFGPVNHLELPAELTGVNARILVLLGIVLPDRRPQGRRGLLVPGRSAAVRARGRGPAHRRLALEVIERDTDRDYYLDAKGAVEYGLVDQVLEMPEKTKEKAKS